MKIICKVLLIIYICGVVSCGGNGRSSQHRDNDNSTASTEVVRQLQFPTIPLEYDTPEKKVSYAVNVYWDKLDFTDRSLSLDTAFMEQSFSNFISLLNYEQDVEPPMIRLVENVSADTLATIFLWDIADKYLNDPNSPMRDGETYHIFLKSLERSPVITDSYRDKLKYKTMIAELNRPGFTANDFHFETRDGKRTTLLASVNGNLTMLVFYDPDCESCNLNFSSKST